MTHLTPQKKKKTHNPFGTLPLPLPVTHTVHTTSPLLPVLHNPPHLPQPLSHQNRHHSPTSIINHMYSNLAFSTESLLSHTTLPLTPSSLITSIPITLNPKKQIPQPPERKFPRHYNPSSTPSREP